MRKHLVSVVLILAFLVILIPFASDNPDGLETVANMLGVQVKEPFWNGLMADYSIAVVSDPYISTLLAGVFGTLIVLSASFLLGTILTPKKNRPLPEPK